MRESGEKRNGKQLLKRSKTASLLAATPLSKGILNDFSSDTSFLLQMRLHLRGIGVIRPGHEGHPIVMGDLC